MSDGLMAVIIEDEEADRFFLVRALRSICPGIAVEEFDYAEQALAWLRRADRRLPDLIFVDINMPRMSGFAFLDAFEDLYAELKAGARVWVMSHSIDPRDRARAQAHPAVSGFLSKTYSAEDLRHVLRAADAAPPDP